MAHNQTNVDTDSFYQNFDKAISMIDQDVSALIESFNIVEAEEGPIPNIYEQFQIIPFAFLSYKDILILSKLLIKQEEEGDFDASNMIARTLAIHFYEFIEDMGQVTGKRMRSQFETLPNAGVLTQKLNAVNKILGVIRKNYRKETELVRLHASAHRDFDVRKQIEIISNLKTDTYKELFILTTQFFLAFHDFFVHFRETFRERT